MSGLLFTAAATWPLAWMGASLYWGDVLLYFLPVLEFTRRTFADGRLPLWNPHVLCGQPFIGNPQSSVLYPTSTLLPFISATRFMSVSVIVHVAIAWVGAYRYARTLELSRSGAVLAAATFVGGGAFLLRLQFPTMFQAMAWMPWLLHCSVRLAYRTSLRRVAAMGVVSAFSILSGHPQIAYLSLLLAASAIVWSLRGIGWRDRVVRLVGWAGSLAVGALASAAYWLPAVDVLRLSARPELALEKADRFSVGWQHVLAMLWPAYVGSPVSGDYWAPGNVWEPALFIGVPQLVFVVIGVACWRRSPAARFHAWLAALCFWLALGVWGGFYALAYAVVPGMSVFHDPARFGIPCALGLACLAGLGADRLRCRLRKWHHAIVAATIAALLSFTTGMTPTVRVEELDYRPRLLAQASGSRIYSPMRQATWDRYVNYADYGAESGRYVHELTDTLTPNIGMRYSLHDAGGYEPVPLRWAGAVEGLLRRSCADQAPVMPSLASAMNVRHILMPVGLSIRQPQLTPLHGRKSVFRLERRPAPVLESPAPVLESPAPVVEQDGAERAGRLMVRGSGRAVRDETQGRVYGQVRLFGHTRVVPSLPRAAELLGQSQFPLDSVAIVSRTVPLPQGLCGAPVPIQCDALLWRPRYDGGACTVSGLRRPCLIVFSISAMPGWKATVDRRPVTPLRANAAFLGVVVPPGRHTVEVSYRPAAFRLGLFVSLVGMMALATIGLAGAIAMRCRAGTLAPSRTTLGNPCIFRA